MRRLTKLLSKHLENEGLMCSQDGAGLGQGKKFAELDDLIEALDEIIAVLDETGEKIAAAHVDMARHVLLSGQA